MRMAHRLEFLVADPVSPHCGPHRLSHIHSSPRTRVSRIPAIPIKECTFQGRDSKKVLPPEPHEILLWNPQITSPQVDGADRAVVDEPVPGVPVPVGRDDERAGPGPARALCLNPIHHHRRNPVWPRQMLLDASPQALVPGCVRLAMLIVESSKKVARLSIRIGIVLSRASFDQFAREICDDKDILGLVRSDKLANGVCVQPRLGPLLVGAELAGNVVVSRTARLDDESLTRGLNLQDSRISEPPGVVGQDAPGTEALVQKAPLGRAETRCAHRAPTVSVGSRRESQQDRTPTPPSKVTPGIVKRLETSRKPTRSCNANDA